MDWLGAAVYSADGMADADGAVDLPMKPYHQEITAFLTSRQAAHVGKLKSVCSQTGTVDIVNQSAP